MGVVQQRPQFLEGHPLVVCTYAVGSLLDNDSLEGSVNRVSILPHQTAYHGFDCCQAYERVRYLYGSLKGVEPFGQSFTSFVGEVELQSHHRHGAQLESFLVLMDTGEISDNVAKFNEKLLQF